MGIAHQSIGEYEGAAEHFLEAKRYRPDHEQARCFEAIAWAFRGDDKKAFELASSIITDFPESALGWGIWITYAPKETSYDEIVSQVPPSAHGDAEVEVNLSRRAHEAGLPGEAERHARCALEDSPDNAEVLAHLGTTLLMNAAVPFKDGLAECPSPEAADRITDAIGFLDRAIDALERFAPPDHLARLLLNRALAARMLGNLHAAARDIEHAHRIAPDFLDATIRFAFLLAERGETEGAIDALRESRSHEATVGIDILLAWFLSRRDSDAERREAIDLLEGLRPALPTMDPRTLVEFVGVLFEAYLDADRDEDAEQLLKEPACAALPASIAAMLRARAAERRGDEESRRNCLRRALAARESILPGDQSARLARELQRAGLCSDALSIWREIVSPDCFGPHTLDLLRCAQESGEDTTILQFCEELRQHGFEERQCIELEAFILEKYGEHDAAINLLRESITKSSDADLAKTLRLRLSVFGLELKRPELVEQDPVMLPAVDIIDPQDLPAIIAVLRHGPDPAQAASFAYKAIRTHFREMPAHMAMIASIMLPVRPKPTFETADTVQPGFAAYFREVGHEDAQPSYFIIEDDEAPDPDRNELPPEHPKAKELLGRSVDDEFNLTPGGMQETRGIVVEIVHKYVARARACMAEWEHRFPDTFFVQKTRLTRTPDGDYDFAPILKSIDDLTKTVVQVERIYTDSLLPLHVFAHHFGKSVVEAVLQVAGTPHLRLRCCAGTDEEKIRAWASLEKGRQVVLDITALASLLLAEAWDLLAVQTDFVVGQSSVDAIRALRNELANRTTGGSVGKIADHYVYTDNQDESVRQQHDAIVSRFDSLLAAIKESCEVSSGLPLASWDPKKREQLLELFGRETAESIAIAAARRATLWTDDLATALVARNEYALERVWTYTVAEWLAKQRVLAKTRLLDLTFKLLDAGYAFTPLSPDAIVEAARRSGWSPDETPLKSVLLEISRPEIQSPGLLRVLGYAIALLWRRQELEGQASRVLLRIMDQVASRPRGHALLQALQQHLDSFFGLNVVDCVTAKTTIQAWRASAPRIVVP